MLPLPPSTAGDGVQLQGWVRTVRAKRFRIVASGPDEYTILPVGSPKGSLVSDGAGGYVLTIGVLTGTGQFVQLGSGDVTIL